MRVFAVLVSLIAATNWGAIVKYAASATTPLVAYFGRRMAKALDKINKTVNEEVPAIKQDVGVVKSDVAAVKSDVAAVKVDVANVKDQVADVSSDLSAVRREVAHRHVENREHLDGLKDEIKRQTSISQETFIKAVGEPLIEISTSMKQNRGPRSTDPPGTGTQQEGT